MEEVYLFVKKLIFKLLATSIDFIIWQSNGQLECNSHVYYESQNSKLVGNLELFCKLHVFKLEIYVNLLARIISLYGFDVCMV